MAAGWLRGLPADSIAEAIAIAAVSAPNQAANGYTRVLGNAVKEGVPVATAIGLTAVELAAAGFTGPVDVLDHVSRFDPDVLTKGLGDTWLIEGCYLKPYSCCRWIHAGLDGLLAIRNEHGIEAKDIIAIDMHTFGATIALSNEIAPRTLEGAQYSTPFCLALAALRGADALQPLQEELLHDADARALAGRVRLHLDPAFEAMFPRKVPCRIAVTTAAGTIDRTVLSPKGEADNPMSWTDLAEKFTVVTGKFIDAVAQRRLRSALRSLGDGDGAPLQAALAAPLALRESAGRR